MQLNSEFWVVCAGFSVFVHCWNRKNKLMSSDIILHPDWNGFCAAGSMTLDKYKQISDIEICKPFLHVIIVSREGRRLECWIQKWHKIQKE